MTSQPDRFDDSSDNCTTPDFATPALPSAAQPAPTDRRLDRFPVVGIGASAGGLDAFTQLLSHIPADTGMAFVLLQHLDPTRPSLLSELLAPLTPLPVQQAAEGMAIAPNQVYVIPSDAILKLVEGKFQLTRRDQTQKINRVVDIFFDSLAQDWGEQAIAVVLSGWDADGSNGLEAIKTAGGITFAQSSDSAYVSSMPNTAISTGQVDFVLPPAGIAAELVDISRHLSMGSPLPRLQAELADQSDALSSIFTLLQSHFGVDFTQYKRTTLQRRLFRRMALHRMEHLSDYARYLQATPSELQVLYQEILIHVTSFFRDANAFEVLKRDVFPVLLRDRLPESPIRIWVAGCSSGEEAYSIAIALLEFLSHQPQQIQLQIFATDVSELAIGRARIGTYLPSQLTDVSADRLQRFFVPIEGGYQISKTVRELCVFARQNLISDPPFSRMDLISCRNVLIYFEPALQKKVLRMFHYGLKPTGFLMLGSSETVGELANLFQLLDRKHKLYAKQSAALTIPVELSSISYATGALPLDQDQEVQPNPINLSDLADQIVLDLYAPVGVVVNPQLDIIQFRGQTGAYLEPSPGQASLNVLSMIKEELRLDLRTAIHQARQEEKPIQKAGIQLKIGDRTRSIQVDVVPIKPGTDSDSFFLILFREMPPLSWQEAPELAMETRKPLSRKKLSREQAEIQRLEQELETTRAHLRSIIEEQQATNQDLRAANEEILSSNEELQSTNEELQTAKEEIQATNEELSTINDELYRRNAETMQVSNDFQNLLGSINIPILMLEADLRIRRFTPTAASLFNLIPTDIGRPLSDINHNLTIADLESQILEVIHTLHLKTQEVQDQTGNWYDLRIRPYRTLDNRIDGAVVVLVEIDALKRSADQLRAAQDYAEAIVETVQEPLLVLDGELRVITANRLFYQTFQLSPSETEQQPIFGLGKGEWNIPSLRSLLEEQLHQQPQVRDLLLEQPVASIGPRQMRLNARRLTLRNGDRLTVLAIQVMNER